MGFEQSGLLRARCDEQALRKPQPAVSRLRDSPTSQQLLNNDSELRSCTLTRDQSSTHTVQGISASSNIEKDVVTDNCSRICRIKRIGNRSWRTSVRQAVAQRTHLISTVVSHFIRDDDFISVS